MDKTNKDLDELGVLYKILTKLNGVEKTLSDVNHRLRSVEAGLEFIRKNFELNGKILSVVQDKLEDHAKEISNLGFEVRGTPTPSLMSPRLVEGKEK
jgi:predicted KAP-like P-loop ATPase